MYVYEDRKWKKSLWQVSELETCSRYRLSPKTILEMIMVAHASNRNDWKIRHGRVSVSVFFSVLPDKILSNVVDMMHLERDWLKEEQARVDSADRHTCLHEQAPATLNVVAHWQKPAISSCTIILAWGTSLHWPPPERPDIVAVKEHACVLHAESFHQSVDIHMLYHPGSIGTFCCTYTRHLNSTWARLGSSCSKQEMICCRQFCWDTASIIITMVIMTWTPVQLEENRVCK